ncbi:unnamed protein product [Brassica napus]|uniref:(rape) hypothetical protein n=1 Tax=Brassica napus TaxID=3708 RepID=A0A816X2B2_BRANA|nr:unnamed protein product [Brassica napus]CAF2141552.1 unnamed protein product [Brassica napus]
METMSSKFHMKMSNAVAFTKFASVDVGKRSSRSSKLVESVSFSENSLSLDLAGKLVVRSRRKLFSVRKSRRELVLFV